MLAGSVNLDVIAAVTPNGEDVIRVKSEGFPLFAVELGDLSVREEERNTSAALVRGVAAWFKGHGCTLEGFDAYLTSNVLKGSGLSSSAAFEVLIGNILNDLFFDGKCTAVELAQIGQYAENVSTYSDGRLGGQHGHHRLRRQCQSRGGAGGLRFRLQPPRPVHRGQRRGPRRSHRRVRRGDP